MQPKTENTIIELVFEPIRQQLKRDLEKWKSTCEARSDAGRLGGIKSGITRGSKRKQKEANEANALKSKQKEANEADIEKEKDIEKDINKKNIIKKENKNSLYLPLAKQLAKILKTNKKISCNLKTIRSWSNDIRLLCTDYQLSTDRIKTALNWYAKKENINNKYTPTILAGRSLRDKFVKLEEAIRRSEENNKSNNNSKPKTTIGYRDPDIVYTDDGEI